MCGRFANQVEHLGEWADLFADWPDGVALGYNIAPSRTVPVFMRAGGQPAGRAMRWGLVPAWSKEAQPKYATFNARVETAPEKPAFRDAWRRGRTCLVPTLGYYEWAGEAGERQPFFIRPENGEPLALAGLWDCRERDGEKQYSCTILTQPARGQLEDLHPRMPVMVERHLAEDWLRDGIHRANLLAFQQHPERLAVYPVSRAVNRPDSDGEQLVQPAEPAA